MAARAVLQLFVGLLLRPSFAFYPFLHVETVPHGSVSLLNDRLSDTLLSGGILEATDEVASVDAIAAAQTASSTHPHFTAEIWLDGKKVAVVRPTWRHDFTPEDQIVSDALSLIRS
jgi:hypothetical protein